MAAKERSPKRVFKVIGIILLVIALFPIPHFYKDGGSIEIMPITGLYSIMFRHEIYSGETIDGVYCEHKSNQTYHYEGLVIRLWSFEIFDNSRVKPELSPHYKEEVSDLASYCKSVCPKEVSFDGITFSDTTEGKSVILDFKKTDSLQTSDEILRLVREFTKSHPDFFISKCNDLYVFFYNMENDDWIRYKVSMPNFTDIKMELVSEAIPDEVPENYDFIEVSKVRAKNAGGTEAVLEQISGVKERNLLSESEAAFLSELYPEAQIGDFDEDVVPHYLH